MKVVALSSIGNVAALFILSAISIAGVGSFILMSAKWFMAIKIAGALYLAYLGIQKIRTLGRNPLAGLESTKSKQKTYLAYFIEAFMVAITNPKPILFFVAIFPQFLNLSSPILPQFFIMTSIFMVISFVSLFTYGYSGKAMKKVFSNEGRMKWFHRVTGGIFISMSVALLQLKAANH